MAGQPNVIVVFTDQQRWDTTGSAGNPLGLTPNYDRLADSGTHARLAVTPQPVCGPARAALQTGRYPTATGCFRNGIPLPVDEPTLAHRFATAGYETAYMGKWHLADDDVA
ncbi:MAG: sulfatase-like hydrolase/transferase, partial [Stackebrandtia sp.]